MCGGEGHCSKDYFTYKNRNRSPAKHKGKVRNPELSSCTLDKMKMSLKSKSIFLLESWKWRWANLKTVTFNTHKSNGYTVMSEIHTERPWPPWWRMWHSNWMSYHGVYSAHAWTCEIWRKDEDILNTEDTIPRIMEDRKSNKRCHYTEFINSNWLNAKLLLRGYWN